MLNSLNDQLKPKKDVSAAASKRSRLSLNLHTMPKTITSHWRKWLILGISILIFFALISFIAFSLMS